MNRNDRVRLFDRWSKTYDVNVLPNRGGRFPWEGYDEVLDRVVQIADAKPGMQLLDLGIGTGNLAVRFLENECVIWGVDFSDEMLAKAREKLPESVLLQANLLDEWPAQLQRRFDRVVSAYVFHEFSFESKISLLQRIAAYHLMVGGSMVVADVAFQSIEARATASRQWPDRWDYEETYWAADETVAVCDRVGLEVTYEQVSICGGVFVFKTKKKANQVGGRIDLPPPTPPSKRVRTRRFRSD
jgi:putative AdoMet-dependent methyltransferase